MLQKIALHTLVYLSGLMAGVLLESRLFHSRRVTAVVSKPIAVPSVPATSEPPQQAPPQK